MSQILSPPVARRGFARFLAVAGPGLVVMLADTDVGSIITAGQSGVAWATGCCSCSFCSCPSCSWCRN